ncbi:hypothetical protein IRV17_10310 [Bacillus cereus]|nr:hypothetical protein [Bacillus cereus]
MVDKRELHEARLTVRYNMGFSKLHSNLTISHPDYGFCKAYIVSIG